MKYLFFLFFIFHISSTGQTIINDTINQYDNGDRKHGKWERKHTKTNNLRYEGQFHHGNPVGEFRYYYEDGKLRTVTSYSDSGAVCYAVSYFDNGEKHAEGEYLHRRRNGKWLFYDGYGNIISEEHYLRGKKHGESITFMPDGQLIEVMNYSEDKAHGEWKRYYSTGQLHIHGYLKNNNWEGEFKFYSMQGSIFADGLYSGSLKQGDWRFFDDEGQIIMVITYKDSQEKEKRIFQKEKTPEYIEMKNTEIIMEKIKK